MQVVLHMGLLNKTLIKNLIVLCLITWPVVKLDLLTLTLTSSSIIMQMETIWNKNKLPDRPHENSGHCSIMHQLAQWKPQPRSYAIILNSNLLSDLLPACKSCLIWYSGKKRRAQADFPGAEKILNQIKNKSDKKRVGIISTTGPPPRGMWLSPPRGMWLALCTDELDRHRVYIYSAIHRICAMIRQLGINLLCSIVRMTSL